MTKEEILEQVIAYTSREHTKIDEMELEDTKIAESWREGYGDALWATEQEVCALLKEVRAERYMEAKSCPN